MRDIYEPERSNPFGRLLLMFVLALILGAAALLLFVRYATVGIWDHIASIVTGRSLSFNTSVPTVVSKIQKLQRLETVTFSMDNVVEGSRTSTVLPDFLAGDRLLLVVHGESIAGIDFSQLKSSDVQLSGKSIHIHLPPPQIFMTKLDNAHTRVYSRTTGVLVPADPNLESEVRQKAEQQLQQSALADGILNTAQANARATVTTMLSSLGFDKVEVN